MLNDAYRQHNRICKLIVNWECLTQTLSFGANKVCGDNNGLSSSPPTNNLKKSWSGWKAERIWSKLFLSQNVMRVYHCLSLRYKCFVSSTIHRSNAGRMTKAHRWVDRLREGGKGKSELMHMFHEVIFSFLSFWWYSKEKVYRIYWKTRSKLKQERIHRRTSSLRSN